MNYSLAEKSVKSGYLFKKGKINRSWQKRWCMLQKDSRLYYYKSPNDKHSGYIQLTQTIIRTSENVERECIFEIITGDRIYLFSADSKYELDDWMKKLFTHSSVQQENDLIEKAEFFIREEALKKSNREDEFLKLKHSIYDLKPTSHQINNSRSSERLEETILISTGNGSPNGIGEKGAGSIGSFKSINGGIPGSAPSSLGSGAGSAMSSTFTFGSHQHPSGGSKSSLVLGAKSNQQPQQIPQVKSYYHPLDLINTNTTANGNGTAPSTPTSNSAPGTPMRSYSHSFSSSSPSPTKRPSQLL